MPISFDSEYAHLQEVGFEGWGGPQFQRRQSGWKRHLAELKASELLPPPPKTVLELGSGNGMVSAMLAADGYAVHGVEISHTAVSWAQRSFCKAGLIGNFRQGDVRTMPYYDAQQFDVIVDGNCLHCLIGEDRSLCLKEVLRLLAPGGIFVLSTMCGLPRSADAIAKFDPASRCLLEDGLPSRTLLPANEILSELQTHGFRVLSQRIVENSSWDHLGAVFTPTGIQTFA